MQSIAISHKDIRTTMQKIAIVFWTLLYLGIAFDVSQHHHADHFEEQQCKIHAIGTALSVIPDVWVGQILFTTTHALILATAAIPLPHKIIELIWARGPPHF